RGGGVSGVAAQRGQADARRRGGEPRRAGARGHPQGDAAVGRHCRGRCTAPRDRSADAAAEAAPHHVTLRFRARRLALAAMGVVCVAVALIASRAHAARWVIPPGQEALAMRMLGGELPGGCRFLGASIEKTQVTARYACAEAETRIALRHPEDAPKA